MIYFSGITNIHLSDHHLTFCELSNMQCPTQKKFNFNRCIARVNKEQFINDFHALPWSLLNIAVDNNDAVNIFESLFRDLWYLHAPIKKYLIRSTNVKHWLNGDLLKAYHQRDVLYKRFCQTGTSAAWTTYR